MFYHFLNSEFPVISNEIDHELELLYNNKLALIDVLSILPLLVLLIYLIHCSVTIIKGQSNNFTIRVSLVPGFFTPKNNYSNR